MNNMSKMKKITSISLCVATVIGVIFQIYLLLFHFDANLQLYAANSILPTCFIVFLALCVVFILLVSLFSSPMLNTTLQKKSGVSICSLIGAVFLTAYALSVLFYILNNHQKIDSTSFIFLIVVVISSFPSALFFLTVWLDKTKKALHTLMSLFPILWCFGQMLSIYFDKYPIISSPIKILDQIALIAIMLYFLMEARCRLSISVPKYYTLTAWASILLGSVSVLPQIVVSIIRMQILDLAFFRYLCTLILICYIAARTFVQLSVPSLEEKATNTKEN